jgi:hypothetical protein
MTPFDVSQTICQRASHEERNESLEVSDADECEGHWLTTVGEPTFHRS